MFYYKGKKKKKKRLKKGRRNQYLNVGHHLAKTLGVITLREMESRIVLLHTVTA